MTMERLHELLRPYGTFDAEGPEELRALIAQPRSSSHLRERPQLAVDAS